jgi:ribonuclease D
MDTPHHRQATPSKAETTLLEPFVGLTLNQVVVPVTDAAFSAATDDIRRAKMVGFDTESKPTFAKGEVSTGPHIVQFAMHDKAYIFQLCQPACHEWLVDILHDGAIQKVGFGLESDRDQIQKKLGIEVNALLDLNTVFRKAGYKQTAGVRASVAIVLNQKFHKSKRVTTTNWSLPRLTSQQLLYAANDAFAAYRVMEAMEARGLGITSWPKQE